jgi:SAM-dependent methyltransferase
MNEEKAKSFWEKCDTTFAHITPDRWLKSRDHLVNSFSKKFDPFNPTDKIIVDYGIGAAHLGIYLFENENIKKYIGIDISERSLNAAKISLSKYDQSKIDLRSTPVDFSKLNADIFCSFAVIQHFPNKEYLDDFLINLKNSGIPEIIIQIRHSRVNAFSDDYDNQEDAKLACRTNKGYVLKMLELYECIKESKIDEKTNYYTLHLKLKIQ